MTSSTDRRYGLIGNTAIKVPVQACATTPITLSGEQTVDGVALVSGDRCLLTGQTVASTNGIYVVDTGAWIRSADFDGPYDVVQGTFIEVNGGTVNGNILFRVTSANPITIGTSSLTFESVPTLTTLSASSGSSLVGFLQAGTGAVATTAQAKLRESVSVLDFGADPTGAADSYHGIQAAHDAIVATGKIGTLIVPPGTYKCSAGLLWDASLVFWDGKGAKLDFSTQTTGIAIDATKGGNCCDLGGLTITGNSNAGSVIGLRYNPSTGGTSVQDVSVKNCVIEVFGIDVQLGNNCFLNRFENCRLLNATIVLQCIGTTNCGENISFVNCTLESSLSGCTIVQAKGTAIFWELYFYGCSFDSNTPTFTAFDLANSNEVCLVNCHIEANDYATIPVTLNGVATRFRMIGGRINSNQTTITANSFVFLDSGIQDHTGGAFFDGVFFNFGTTALGVFVTGAKAANCVIANPAGGPLPFALSTATNLVPELNQSGNGSFTPALAGSITAGTQTYSIQNGEFTKIGNLVFASFRLVLTGFDGATAGDMRITGFPFVSAGGTYTRFPIILAGWANIDLTSYISMTGIIQPGLTYVALLKNALNGAQATVGAANMSATSSIEGTLVYRVVSP